MPTARQQVPPPAPSEAPLLLSQVQAGVGKITLNNPRRRNALSRAMLEALRGELAQMQANAEVRVIIIAAVGPVFSSGHDLREVAAGDAEKVTSLLELCTQVMESIRLLPKPVIAQVQALASAAGCQLVATCDLAVASAEAAFQTPGLKIGLFCSTPMVPLSRVVPRKKALEMLLTAEPIPAEEAERIGLINRVVPPQSLESATLELAHQVARYSLETIAIGKTAFYQQLPLAQEDAYGVGCNAMLRNAATADAQEGMGAFLDKREPHWKH